MPWGSRARVRDFVTSRKRETLGQRIRGLRESRRMSLGDLATASGVSKGYLSLIERGLKGDPGSKRLQMIAQALGVTTSEILGEQKNDGHRLADLPPGLSAFVESRIARSAPLTEEEIDLLRRVSARTRVPIPIDDWAYLYETIRRICRIGQ